MATGAERAIEAARVCGVELCLANPGTTEIPLVQALERVGGIRAVLCLHENTCTGAADGYARLAGKPALALLHLGPGLANGAANLHNARRAKAPVVALVGEHASWHMAADAPLTMPIEQLAGTFSRWVGRVGSPDAAAGAMTEAIAAAVSGNGGVVTLVVPHDFQMSEAMADTPAAGTAPEPFPPLDHGAVAAAAELLRGRGARALFLGGRALWGEGLHLAGRIARATGCRLIGEVAFARLETGQGLPVVERLPYFPERAQALLDEFATVVGIGAKSPVSFFGWPGQPGRYLEGREQVVWLAGPDDDALAALRALATALGAAETSASDAGVAAPDAPLDPPTGPLDAEKIGRTVAALQPEGAVVVLTAVTSAYPYSAVAHRARPHIQLALTGGAIGEGMAMAIGAALAAPDRKVIHLEADGSAAYAMSALWTQAREGLDIVTIVCANRAYRILELELARAGVVAPGPVARGLTDLGRPPIDWVGIARAQAVPGERVETAEALAEVLRRGLAEPGPYLIEAAC